MLPDHLACHLQRRTHACHRLATAACLAAEMCTQVSLGAGLLSGLPTTSCHTAAATAPGCLILSGLAAVRRGPLNCHHQFCCQACCSACLQRNSPGTQVHSAHCTATAAQLTRTHTQHCAAASSGPGSVLLPAAGQPGPRAALAPQTSRAAGVAPTAPTAMRATTPGCRSCFGGASGAPPAAAAVAAPSLCSRRSFGPRQVASRQGRPASSRAPHSAQRPRSSPAPDRASPPRVITLRQARADAGPAVLWPAASAEPSRWPGRGAAPGAAPALPVSCCCCCCCAAGCGESGGCAISACCTAAVHCHATAAPTTDTPAAQSQDGPSSPSHPWLAPPTPCSAAARTAPATAPFKPLLGPPASHAAPLQQSAKAVACKAAAAAQPRRHAGWCAGGQASSSAQNCRHEACRGRQCA